MDDTLPTWAEQNMDLRRARDAMNEQKRLEAFERKQAQQQEQQRQFHQQSLGFVPSRIGFVPGRLDPSRDCPVTVPVPSRDTRPKRCVAGL